MLQRFALLSQLAHIGHSLPALLCFEAAPDGSERPVETEVAAAEAAVQRASFQELPCTEAMAQLEMMLKSNPLSDSLDNLDPEVLGPIEAKLPETVEEMSRKLRESITANAVKLSPVKGKPIEGSQEAEPCPPNAGTELVEPKDPAKTHEDPATPAPKDTSKETQVSKAGLLAPNRDSQGFPVDVGGRVWESALEMIMQRYAEIAEIYRLRSINTFLKICFDKRLWRRQYLEVLSLSSSSVFFTYCIGPAFPLQKPCPIQHKKEIMLEFSLLKSLLKSVDFSIF